MGQRGPAPTSKQDLQRRGSWRGKNCDDDMVLESAAPKPPSDMTREGKAEWKRVVKILGPGGKNVLAETDRAALVVMCESWAEYREFDKTMKKMMKVSGFTMDVKRLASAKHEAYQRWQAMASRFGMTPADRPRVKVNSKKKEQHGKGRFKKKQLGLVG